MKKILIIITTIFLLTSCYSNPDDTKKIEELENKINSLELKIKKNNIKEKEFLFNKNKECSKLGEGTPFVEEYMYTNDTKRFYSKKLNTCIITTEIFYKNNKGGGYYIDDSITGENLIAYICPEFISCEEAEQKFYHKINELKNN